MQVFEIHSFFILNVKLYNVEIVQIIVFVWSQLDGGKVEQKNNGISSHQNLMMP